ncbi:MAG: hypothetical protein V9G24_19630 [Rhodoblastus sp.]
MMRAPGFVYVVVVVLGATAIHAQQGGGLSNPLWSTPLETIAATRDRPLFTQSRRPPPLAEARPASDATPILGPGAPPFSLVGTVVGDREKFAVMLETGSQNVLRLPLGASASGWRVAEVAARSVTLTRGPQSVTLELPKPAVR